MSAQRKYWQGLKKLSFVQSQTGVEKNCLLSRVKQTKTFCPDLDKRKLPFVRIVEHSMHAYQNVWRLWQILIKQCPQRTCNIFLRLKTFQLVLPVWSQNTCHPKYQWFGQWSLPCSSWYSTSKLNQSIRTYEMDLFWLRLSVLRYHWLISLFQHQYLQTRMWKN